MITKTFLPILAIIAIVSQYGEALRVLGLFPHLSLSHFEFFHPIMRGLADAGHNVTVVSFFPDSDAPANYEDLLLKDEPLLTNSIDLKKFSQRISLYSVDHFVIFSTMYTRGMELCKSTLNSSAVQYLLNTRQQYDVVLVEQFHSDCMMGVAWKLQAPVIGLSSCVLMPWHYDRVGQPLLPSYVPTTMLGYSDHMTYPERLSNWISAMAMRWFYDSIFLRDNDAITRKFIKDENMPHLRELVKQTSMIFANSHYSYTGVKPNSPAVVEVGGVHIKEAKPLDAELQALLDSATEGVIVVSWGSMIRSDSLPIEMRTALLKAFASFEQKVIWKWENETLPNQPKNVHIRKWLPQRDILCHPNVRVFVTHGGLLGGSESVHCGKPMVITPMFGDQFLNAAAAKARGIGFIVPYDDITEETMKDAITEALSDHALENMKKVSYSYTHRPRTPVESAVFWTEYVAATKGAPLMKSHMTNMSAFVYYSFDVYLTIGLALSFVVIFWVYLIRKCIRRAPSHKSKVD